MSVSYKALFLQRTMLGLMFCCSLCFCLKPDRWLSFRYKNWLILFDPVVVVHGVVTQDLKLFIKQSDFNLYTLMSVKYAQKKPRLHTGWCDTVPHWPISSVLHPNNLTCVWSDEVLRAEMADSDLWFDPRCNPWLINLHRLATSCSYVTQVCAICFVQSYTVLCLLPTIKAAAGKHFRPSISFQIHGKESFFGSFSCCHKNPFSILMLLRQPLDFFATDWRTDFFLLLSN